MKGRIQPIWILLILSALLGACGKAPHYEKVVSFDNNEWNQKQKPQFEVEIDDTTAVYAFVLTVRTTTEYGFNNLWIFWNTKTPSGEKVREPFELKITNPDGTWVGKNSGTVVENQLHFRNRKIAEKGTYTFTLEQGITEPVIGDVLDVGLSVEKNPETQQ